MIYRLRTYGWLLIVVGVAACGTFPLPPVSEQGRGVRHPESEYRVVQTGDTLYSIAWESGRDYQELARWNGISPPYVIKPGQRLRLYPPSTSVRTYRPEPAPPPSDGGRKKSPSADSAPSSETRVAVHGKLSWVWPTQGEVLERFTANGPNKGIDISGRLGQAIIAAESGQVVYQGSGLRGYGQLIIVKHNADFLSAYAHCDKIYVREGNVVKRGQKIADLGNTGTDRPKLHFEVRYRGAPVDPLEHLPRK